MNLSAGTKLGPYEILSPLGAGGMGEVYRARNTTDGKACAYAFAHFLDDVFPVKGLKKVCRGAQRMYFNP